MKVRGSLLITKDLQLENTSGTVPFNGAYLQANIDGKVYFGDLVVYEVEDKIYPKKGSLVIDSNTLYVSSRNNASGSLPLDLFYWETFGSGGGGGDTTIDITASIGVGGIALGDIIPRGTDLTDFVTDLISPLILPIVKEQNYVIVNGLSSNTLEVGTAIIAQLSTVYIQGLIESKNGASDVVLTGTSTGTFYSGAGITTGGNINTLAILGTNMWSASESFSVGTVPYYDSDGNVATNLDSQRGPGSVSDDTPAITGKYKYWFSAGSIPTTSAGVRALPDSGFYPITVFDISIPIGITQVSFYLPATHGIVTVKYVESSNADVTSTFSETLMNVEDAGGTIVNYSRFDTIIPGIGYSSIATYRVTII